MEGDRGDDLELATAKSAKASACKNGPLLRATALLTGLSLSLPLSSTLVAARFFDTRLEDPRISYAFTAFYGATFIGIKFLIAIGRMLLSRGTDGPGGVSSERRMRACVGGLAATLLALLALLAMDGVTGLRLAAAILALTLVMAYLTSTIESGSLAMFAGCPAYATQSLFIGQGLAGIWSSAISLVFADSQYFAIANYGLSVLVVAACTACWMSLTLQDCGEHSPIIKNSQQVWDLEAVVLIARQIPDLVVAVSLTSVLSMTMFPFMVNKTLSSFNLLSPTLFYPLAFLASNLADLIGKWLPSVADERAGLPCPILPLACTRIVVLFVLITGRVSVLGDARILPISLYSSDVVFFSMLLVSGIVNGFVLTTCAVHGPLRIPEAESAAASVLGIVGMGSSFAGCLCSIAMSYLLRNLAA